MKKKALPPTTKRTSTRTHRQVFVLNDDENKALNRYRDWETDRKSTRLNSSHSGESRMPSSA